ncbi:cell division control protein Cdc6 [Tothia fuscella]|uniref:Cell division control protein n=1 Tax=Tothia fuscella TaxID=1048955 RepID=A0A9P4NW46_9PEZI|nr:cell division control protein Cdc6 [Tothia fuscella]
MARVAVLGKRTRSSTEQEETTTPRTTRAAKRRAEFVIAADDTEDDNPFVSRKTRKTIHHGESMDVDELASENASPPKRNVSTRSTPAKHGAFEKRIPLSPAKKNQILNVVPIDVAEDSKPPTPSTPRHRDALSKRVPVTPRHRVGIFGKLATPQTPHTPTTPRTSGPSVYNEARQMFARGVNPEKLIGREKERSELFDFVSKRLEKQKSGCLYISGPPGTGKSALANEVVKELQEGLTFRSTYVNCMSVKTAKDIFAKLLEDFEKEEVREGSENAALEKLFYNKKRAYLVTLDEIDHLMDVDMDLLHKLFEWSLDASSNLVIVGIANALDFTDRFLPRLKSRGLRPQLQPFMPYTPAQIAEVVNSKLKSLLPSDTTASADFVPFIHPMAVTFASKKVAAQTGDLRKVFAICLRAIDLIESETRATLSKSTSELTPSPTPSPSKTPLMDNINLSSPVRSPKKSRAPINPMAHLTIEKAPRATIAHMARVTAAVFSNGSTQRLATLNLQQKAVLCSLSYLSRKPSAYDTPSTPSRSASAPTIKSLFETYTSLCKNDNLLHPLTSTEFRDVVAGLETLSLVSWVNGRNGTFTNVAPGTPSKRGRGGGFGGKVVEEKRVVSSVGVNEVRDALQGAGSGILLCLLDGEGI